MSNTKPTPYGFAIIAHGVFQKFVRRDDVAAEVLAQCVASDPNATAIPLCAADALTGQAATIAEQARELEALRAHNQLLADANKELRDEAERDHRQIEALRADAERLRDALALAFRSLTESIDVVRAEVDQRHKWYGGMPTRVAQLAGLGRWLADHEAAIAAASAALQASEPTEGDKCRKCGGRMGEGTYLAQTMTGTPDFPGDTHAVTVSPSGPGRLAECLKCDACGHSVTAGKAVTP